MASVAQPSVASPKKTSPPVGPSIPVIGASPPQLLELSKARRLGLSESEMLHIQEHFRNEGRDPTVVEMAGIAQSWSEHCSYKSSRPVLSRHFGGLPKSDRVLGRGDAGVMALDDRWAYALRIESHNHPSAVEPYGGAATGIGGILRDVLAVGGKPVALADPLFFGPLDLPLEKVPPGIKHPRYLFANVIAGIRDYGNRVGVPTIAGSLTFDEAYTVNPLVNVACVGLLERKRLLPNRATAVGQGLVLVGGLTGRDGIGGVAFASREISRQSETESRGAVQLGNAIMKEPVIRACLEANEAGLIAGLKDLGGGGIASCSGELVHAGGLGSEIHLDRVPLREPDLEPWEVWISESQERMLLAVDPENLDRVRGIFARHDVPATLIGVVTSGHRERLHWKGELVADLELAFRIDAPLPARPSKPRGPAPPETLAAPPEDLTQLVAGLLRHADAVSREPVIRVYDHEVQGRLVIKPLQGTTRTPSHGDGSVLRWDDEGYGGLALALGSAPFVAALDPRRGGQAVVEEAARNLYALGARPDALTNCLNFGNPEDPHVMGDLDAVVAGMAEACRILGVPVPSGNVSLYNEGLGAAIPPTPVVLATGLVPDVRRCLTSDLKRDGNTLILLGRTSPALGGSLYARWSGSRATHVPPFDGHELRSAGEALLGLGAAGCLASCHDVGEGGLAVALAEMAFGGNLGFDVDVGSIGIEPAWRALVAEGGSRWVLEVAPEHLNKVMVRLEKFPMARLGTVTSKGGRLRQGTKVLAELDLPALYASWRNGLETLGRDAVEG